MLPVSGYAMVFSGALSFVKDSYNNFYGHTIKPLVDDGWLVNTFNFYALGAFPAVKRAMQIKNADKNAYPDLCRFSIGPRINIVVLNSPEFRKQLAAPNRYSEKMRGGDEFNFLNDEIGCKGNAFTEENEETKREYKRLGNNHHFGITALKDKVPQMISIFENLENYRAGNTGHLDFSRLARKLSLELVQRIILERDELIEGLEDAVDIKQKAMTDKILWSPESWLPGFIPTENNKLYNEGSAAFNNAVQELMDNPSGLTKILHEKFSEEEEEEEEVRGYLMMVLFIGSTTMKSAIESLIHFLIDNQEYQERIRDEIANIDQTDDLYKALKDSPLFNAVIEETLRIKPPVIGQTRVLKQGMYFGEHYVEAGTTVYGANYWGNRNRRHWDQPTKWLPDRWLKTVNGKEVFRRDLPKTLSFGYGNTICLAHQYAPLALKTFLYTAIKNWQFKNPISVYGTEFVQILRSQGGLTHEYNQPVLGGLEKIKADVPRNGSVS